MKYLMQAAALAATASACVSDDNNWFCDQVRAITYAGVGGVGSYDKITNMNSNALEDSQCSSAPFGYSGSMSPLDEEVCSRTRKRLARIHGILERRLVPVS